MPLASTTISCPAKVNFALSVGAPNTQGMHEIVSLMAAVNFSDELSLQVSEELGSAFDISFAPSPPNATERTTVDWPLESDLAYRAHQLLQNYCEKPLPVNARIAKRIPTGAGLGGGSSDAAGMLVGLDRMFDLKIEKQNLIKLSSELGSDVAFFVSTLADKEKQAAIVSGLGDVVEPVAALSITHLVLVFPPFGCQTSKVYHAFDKMHHFAKEEVLSQHHRALATHKVRELAEADPLPQDGPFNDLAEPACLTEPRLQQARKQVEDAMQLPVHITGSGSTMFVVAPSALTASVLVRKVEALTEMPAIATRTL
jgi:4-diphosphocytidyl-2-C-methyl-D-erythritol kinase